MVDSRLFRLAYLFIENFEEVFQYGASNRLFNIPVSVLGGLVGGGLFGLRFADVEQVELLGQSFLLHSKLHGGYVELVYRFGIFGLIAVLLILASVIQRRKGVLAQVRGINYFIFAYVILVPFQYGPILNPLPLIFIAICVHANRFPFLGGRRIRHLKILIRRPPR
jgi:hypothetical protein